MTSALSVDAGQRGAADSEIVCERRMSSELI
jgi:hypothetical protein